jgi:hypothetical protein
MFYTHSTKRSSSREQTARWIENLTAGSARPEDEKRELRALASHFRAPEPVTAASSRLLPETRKIP